MNNSDTLGPVVSEWISAPEMGAGTSLFLGGVITRALNEPYHGAGANSANFSRLLLYNTASESRRSELGGQCVEQLIAVQRYINSLP